MAVWPTFCSDWPGARLSITLQNMEIYFVNHDLITSNVTLVARLASEPACTIPGPWNRIMYMEVL